MRLHKHFLKEDLYQASKEFNCFKDCLELTMLNVERGNLELANARMQDVNRSLKELTRLATKKDEVNSINVLIQHMRQKGIDIQIIREIAND